MLLVDVQNIVVSYGADIVLDGVSLRVDEGDRIGLIGRNGEGKTTLLQAIIGNHSPDSGSVVMPNYIRFAYLQQDQVHTRQLPLFEDMKSVFEETLRKRHRIKELEELMASDTENSQYLREYGQLIDEYEAADGDQIERKIEEVLKGLGFYEHEFTKPVKDLSGGQRNRAALARVLLTGADLLLLDEPTNHLDLNGIEFLENYLTGYRGGAIIISHDRTFLDNVANSICEAQRQKLFFYPKVNYSGYLPLKRKQHELQLKKFERQQAEIERQEEFIRRNIVGQKTKQAQSRRRMLAKLERMERPAEDTSGMKPVVTDIARSGLKVAEVSDVYKSYEDNHVLNGVSVELERGEAVGIIGPNACGKSTLLKIISGLIEADRGTVKIGSKVSVGYFSQHRDDIEYSRTILDQVWDLVPDWEEVRVRGYLGRFLFTDQEPLRVASSLSGGERARLALAMLFLRKHNFLVMDEPTNHLDISAREVLEETLGDFPGTLLIVSHDRYFLNGIIDKLYVFENNHLKCYAGNYDYYLEKRKEFEVPEPEPTKKQIKSNSGKSLQSYIESKERSRKVQRVKKLEKEIGALESKIEQKRKEMSSENIASDWGKLSMLENEVQELQDTLDSLIKQWEEMAEEI